MDTQSNFCLTSHNTLGLVSCAERAVCVRTVKELEAALVRAQRNGMRVKILGQGSNVVLCERINALVVLMQITGCTISGRAENEVLVSAGAGLSWHRLVEWTLANDLPGLENLAGIPGTVGAAPVQNIGAYGAELADFFHSLVALDRTTMRYQRMGKQACGFGYRHSIFKREQDRFIIVEVTLALPNKWKPRISYRGLENLESSAPLEIMNSVLALRRRKLPDWRRQGNAGSFFHNPVIDRTHADALRRRHPDLPAHNGPGGSAKLSAGWLIEQCGLKGFTIGGAGMSKEHALVLVNHGNAHQQDVKQLAEHVCQSVRDRFGIDLVQEPQWIG